MASRKEEKERRRRERLAGEQAEREDTRRRRLRGILSGGVLAIAVIAAVVVVVVVGGGDSNDSSGESQLADATSPPAQKITALSDAAKAADCKLQNPDIEGDRHLSPDSEPPEYGTDPPTSGDHDPTPTEDGAHDDAQPSGGLLHALEHGRIELQYKPSIDDRRIGELRGLFNEDQYHMLLVPNDSMPFEIAATAWGHLAGCENASDETFDVMRSFRDRYRDKGPEFIP